MMEVFTFSITHLIIWILSLISFLWVTIDVLRSRKKSIYKALWIVFAIFFSIITAIVYYFVNKR